MKIEAKKPHTNQAALQISAKGASTEGRAFRAAVLRLAAKIEEATDADARWVLHADGFESWGAPSRTEFRANLWIELHAATAAEQNAADALLERFAGTH